MPENRLRRATFFRQYPITVNPATRHQAFCVKNLVPMFQGIAENQRRGSTIFVEGIKITATVSSDVFLRTFTRVTRPPAPLSRSLTYFSNNPGLEAKSAIDADFTGFKALMTGVTVPVDAQEITQSNNTVFPRCTLAQEELITRIGVGAPNIALLETNTDPVESDPVYTRNYSNYQDIYYRHMIFSTNTPPTLTATIPSEFFDQLSTTSVYDPTFTGYINYPPLQCLKDKEYWETQILCDKYDKLGQELTNVHTEEINFQTPHQIYFGSDNAEDLPQRGGLYMLMCSEVNNGFSDTLSTDTYLEPIRLNSRWLVTVVTEVLYYD
jgi:hypothetical protein